MANNYWKNQKRREKEEERRLQEEREWHARSERWNNLWNVPEHARDAFIAMADVIGEGPADTILAFVEAMLSEPEGGNG